METREPGALTGENVKRGAQASGLQVEVFIAACDPFSMRRRSRALQHLPQLGSGVVQPPL